MIPIGVHPFSILVVYHNPIFGDALKRFLNEVGGFQIKDISGNILIHPDEVVQFSPDIILVDLESPIAQTIEMIRSFRCYLPVAVIISLTNLEPVYYNESILSAGADAFVVKTEIVSVLVSTMRTLWIKKRGSPGVNKAIGLPII